MKLVCSGGHWAPPLWPMGRQRGRNQKGMADSRSGVLLAGKVVDVGDAEGLHGCLPDPPQNVAQQHEVVQGKRRRRRKRKSSYMKSTITQLERRFDIPSYLIGVIDGSFEIGRTVLRVTRSPSAEQENSAGK
ncbi:hypothetical protein CRUP_020252 [Coryphaenoides rupestris]|nr:hypothetical protein CRUP_020252 [Coryphaenoides rupestris]